jgi:DNA-binding MarR family transcriptional regulator
MTEDPERCSCAALRQAARHVTRLYDAALVPVGLRLNQYSILARLKRFGPMRLSELADRLVMDRSTLGHLLRPIEARGLLALRVDERDRRGRLVALTATGEVLTSRAHALWLRAETSFAGAFGQHEAVALRHVLKRVETTTFERTTS